MTAPTTPGSTGNATTTTKSGGRDNANDDDTDGLVVHSVGIPPDSAGTGTKVNGRHGMVPEQAAECALILS